MHAPDHNLPLFVYGTLLSDQPAFDLIAAAVEHSAPGVVDGLALHSVGPYPLAVPGIGQIHGELHWLRADGYVALLGELELYEGPAYVRRAYPVRQRDTNERVAAWIFIGDPAQAAHLPLIPHGHWRRWIEK
jgi:gamma-glutamylcyclotransferase (GGCT)/AIG2-like uncharacterized protein YtfP